MQLALLTRLFTQGGGSPSTSTWARAIASVRAPRHNAQLEGTVI